MFTIVNAYTFMSNMQIRKHEDVTINHVEFHKEFDIIQWSFV